MKQRFITRDKNAATYAVWDTVLRQWCEDTEDTEIDNVHQWADDLNNEYTQAPPHGSLYGEPCGDRK